jgi:hypothetical protein
MKALRRLLRWLRCGSSHCDHERRIQRLEEHMREMTRAFNRRGTKNDVREFR